MSNTLLLRRRHIGTPVVQSLNLYIKMRESGTITFTQRGSGSLYISRDNELTWEIMTSGVATETLAVGAKIFFKGNISPNLSTNWSTMGIGTFSVSGQFEVGGCPLSLISMENFSLTDPTPDKAFCTLFYNALNLVSCESVLLPSGAVGAHSYRNMFLQCRNMTGFMEELPAMTLGTYCYESMFKDCNVMTRAPRLPAISGDTHSYDQIFANNFILNDVSCMLETFASGICSNWLSQVASTGTFYKKTGISWATGASGIPTGWTVVEV